MIFINFLLYDCDGVNTQANASIEIVSGKRICRVVLCHLSPNHYTNHIQIIYVSFSFLIYIITYAAFVGRRILGQSSNRIVSRQFQVSHLHRNTSIHSIESARMSILFP